MSSLEITALNVGALRFDLSTIYDLPQKHPYAGQAPAVPLYSYLIRRPGRIVLLDAMAYDLAEIPAVFRLEDYVPPPALPQQITALGLDLGEVDDVVITHAHFDHYGALAVERNGRYAPTFPKARHYLGAADWEPEQFDDFDRRTLGLVHDRGLLTLVEGAMDLGQGLHIMPAAGETEGHQILKVEADGQRCYFVGDLYHHPLEFGDERANVNWADGGQMLLSKRKLMESAAANQAAVYFSHISGPYQVVKDGQGELVWVKQ